MYLTKEVKAEIFKKHSGSETNTGSAESQIAYLHIVLIT